MQVTVLGTGTIGSTVAYILATNGVDVRVSDVDEEKNHGHAFDIAHSLAHASHPLYRDSPTGTIKTLTADAALPTDTDVLVVTASTPRPNGADQRGGRLEWLESNLALAGDIGERIRGLTHRPVIVVTNPTDVITYELSRQTGWPASYFVGYSLSETARLAYSLAEEYGVPYDEVYCPVLGEHGENLVPVFSRATVGGQEIDLDDTQRCRHLDYVRDVPYEVMRLRGSQESSRWVTGRGVALVARTILAGGTDTPIGLSTPLDGEYGYGDVSLGVPVTLDEMGVERIVEWDLTGWERERMDEAYLSVRENIQT